MKRVITLMLHAGLVVTSVAAILFAVRIILEQLLGIGSWYWGGAIGAFFGPLAFATALFLFERCTGSLAAESPNA